MADILIRLMIAFPLLLLSVLLVASVIILAWVALEERLVGSSRRDATSLVADGSVTDSAR